MTNIDCLRCRKVIPVASMICPECGTIFFKLDTKYLYKTIDETTEEAGSEQKSKLRQGTVAVQNEHEKNQNILWENDDIHPDLLWEWQEKYDLGIESIDDQHKQILILINKLHDSIKKGTRDHKLIQQTLQTLDMYIREHFEYEEKILLALKYPSLKMHKLKHREFEQNVGGLHRKFEKEFFDLKDVLSFLTGWFIEHIQGTDKRYSEFITTSKGLST